MKSNLVFIAVTVIFTSAVLTSCGSSKQAANYKPITGGEVYEMPCQMYDDDDWFYATGVRAVRTLP